MRTGGREKNQRCGAGIEGHVGGKKILTSASIIFFSAKPYLRPGLPMRLKIILLIIILPIKSSDVTIKTAFCM